MRFMTAAFAFIAGLAFALPAAQARDEEGACHADAVKLCKDVKPGGGRVFNCLKQHESELSSPCRERMAAGKKRADEFKEACKPDSEKLCKDIQAGPGKMMRCLVDHKTELSQSCKQKIAELEQRHPCMADAERLCKGVQAGQGQMAQCMKSHESELSAECKANMRQHHEKMHGQPKQ